MKHKLQYKGDSDMEKQLEKLEFYEPTSEGCRGVGVGEVMDLSILAGCTVTRAGVIASGKFKGRLAIEYRDKYGVEQRVVLEFCDLGIWVASCTNSENQQLTQLMKNLDDFFLSDFCDEDIWENCTVRENNLEKSFEFLSDGKSMITFNLKEIELMPIEVRYLFRTPETRKDPSKILKALNEWFFYTFDPTNDFD
jgi:hypothetical protein